MVTDRKTRIVTGSVTAIGIGLLIVWSLGPIYWVVVTSLKRSKEIYSFPPTLYPHVPTLSNFYDALFRWDFPRFIYNSAVIAISVTLLSIVIARARRLPDRPPAVPRPQGIGSQPSSRPTCCRRRCCSFRCSWCSSGSA